MLIMPIEVSLQREQQDAPTAASSTRELQGSHPTDETTMDEQHNLRRSPRQSKPVQRLIEAMQAELQDQPLPGEIFSVSAMFRVSKYHKVPPYFQQYGTCVGNDESTQE
jgi:hypothetical protein